MLNVKVDGVKGDVEGLKGRVDRHDQRLDTYKTTLQITLHVLQQQKIMLK